MVCQDDNGCTDDACDPATGECAFTPNSAPCDDGDACTTGDVCGGGACEGAAIDCGDPDPCVDTWCDAATGCQAAFNDAPCDDQSECTLGDECLAGECVGVPITALDCDDLDACTTDTCDPAAGCSWTPLTCDDQSACTADTCDPASGCVFTDTCDDSDACTTDGCDPAFGCTHDDLACGDGSACTDDSCDPTTGCAHLAVVCDDQSACTADGCDPATGCTHDDVACGDGSACTDDSCDPTTGCAHLAVVCDDQSACTADGCDPATGCTFDDIVCDDGDPCTTDWCSPATGCIHSPQPGFACDDGSACTLAQCQAPTVSAKSCGQLGWDTAGGADDSVCAASDAAPLPGCTGYSAWDEARKVCTAAGARLCTLGELFAEESYATGCNYDSTPVPIWTDSPCGDNSYWAGPGTLDNKSVVPPRCMRAESAGAVVRCCADADPPAAAATVACVAHAAACSDPSGCGVTTCDPDAGCATQTLSTCDDGKDCTTESCNAFAGCSDSVPHDALCDDGADCTADTCDPAVGCTYAPNHAACADDNPCTNESCQAWSGCVYSSTGGSCDDGNPCTVASCQQPATSSKSCDQLDWGAGYGSAEVCAATSQAPIGVCASGYTWAQAEDVCLTAGARLCTVNELLDDESRGTGCGYDAHHVWSSSPCDSGTAYWVSPGNADNVGSLPPKCVPTGATASVRCCADATPTAVVPGCLATDSACGGDPACGDSICDVDLGCVEPQGYNDCCNSNNSCPVAACRDCACALDSFCCDTWDKFCAECATGTGPGYNNACANSNCTEWCGCTGPGSCCGPSGSGGCGDQSCEDCVCGQDPFCCSSEWDQYCVQCADGSGSGYNGACSGQPCVSACGCDCD